MGGRVVEGSGLETLKAQSHGVTASPKLPVLCGIFAAGALLV